MIRDVLMPAKGHPARLLTGFLLALLMLGPASAEGEPSSPADFMAGLKAYEASRLEEALERWLPLAERGDVDAEYNVGALYDSAIGSLRDPTKAARWYGVAAEHRLAIAGLALARLARRGESGTVNRDQALQQIKAAAYKGSADAQYELGVAFDRGDGVTQNFATAASWYQRAADQGLATAQYNLATLYDEGLGTAKDPQRALYWYRKAAEAGSPLAENNLGAMYERGLGLPQDYAEAARWYAHAARRGLATAQTNLGIMHSLGKGVPRNYPQALRWFRAAADQGHAEAQLNLAYLYANGLGVERDLVQAMRWLVLAAAATGDESVAVRAARQIELVRPLLSPEANEQAITQVNQFTAAPSAVTRSTQLQPTPAPKSPEQFGAPTLAAQRYLAMLGHYDGVIDGAPGPQTQAAVKAFQKEVGLSPVDGLIGPDLLDTLRRVWTNSQPEAASHAATNVQTVPNEAGGASDLNEDEETAPTLPDMPAAAPAAAPDD
jgi:hypothetical protein